MTRIVQHLSDNDVLDAVAQEGLHSPWEDHLSECALCQLKLEQFAADKPYWNEVKESLVMPEVELEMSSWSASGLATNKRERFAKEERSLVAQLLEAPTHPEMLGRIDRYEVERIIGTGGMGVVFKAYDTELHRPVAIKFLSPQLIHSGAARKRFAREARAAAAIVNDHVIPIHNVRTDSEHPYIVMQYIAGDSLQERIDREGPLEVSEVLRIGMHIATGLAAAHSQGLTHRDIKPSNIMLDENVSRAMLTDFGLAHTNDEACLTRSGVQLGTPHYMSPEQVRGESIDHRSDLFSLGCVLYTLCTGRPPFRAEQAYAIMRRITDEQPRSIREINSAVPEWLEAIILRLMDKRLANRFQSAQEVHKVLELCLAHVTHPSKNELPLSLKTSSRGFGKSRSFVSWIVGGSGFVGAIVAGVLLFIETSKGTIIIESESADVPIRISKSGQVVDQLTVNQSGKSIRVGAGEYTIELENPDSTLELNGERVTVKRGEASLVKISLSPQPFQTANTPRPLRGEGPETNVQVPSSLLAKLLLTDQGNEVETIHDGMIKQVAKRIMNSTAQVLEHPRLWEGVELMIHMNRAEDVASKPYSKMSRAESGNGGKVEIYLKGNLQQIIDYQLPDQIRQAGIWAMIPPSPPRWIQVGFGKQQMLPVERLKLTDQFLQARKAGKHESINARFLMSHEYPQEMTPEMFESMSLCLMDFLKETRGIKDIVNFAKITPPSPDHLVIALDSTLGFGSPTELDDAMHRWIDGIRATNEKPTNATSFSSWPKADIDASPTSFPEKMHGRWKVKAAARGSFSLPEYFEQQVDIDSQHIWLRTGSSSNRYQITYLSPLPYDFYEINLTALAPDGSGTQTYECVIQNTGNQFSICMPLDFAMPRPHWASLDNSESVSELRLYMDRHNGQSRPSDLLGSRLNPAMPRWISVGYGKLGMTKLERQELVLHWQRVRESGLKIKISQGFLSAVEYPPSLAKEYEATSMCLMQFLVAMRGLPAILEFANSIQEKQDFVESLKSELEFESIEQLESHFEAWMNGLLQSSDDANSSIKEIVIGPPATSTANGVAQPPNPIHTELSPGILPAAIRGHWRIENATTRSAARSDYIGKDVWIDGESITIQWNESTSRYRITHWKPLIDNVFEADLTVSQPNSTETKTFYCLISIDEQKLRLCRPQKDGWNRPSRSELDGEYSERGSTLFELEPADDDRLSHSEAKAIRSLPSVRIGTSATDSTQLIASVVEEFNRISKQTFASHGCPPLSEDEVLAALLWQSHLVDKNALPKFSELMTRVALSRELPPGWSIFAELRTWGEGGHKLESMALVLGNADQSAVCKIRQQWVKAPKVLLNPTSETDDKESVDLATAISRFNAANRSAGQFGDQPPVTLEEVLAAIEAFDAPSVEAGTRLKLKDIARTHRLDASSKFEGGVMNLSQTDDVNCYVWHVNLRVPQDSNPDWTFALRIRERYLGSDAFNSQTIHWGAPAANGLQSGFRLEPAQKFYLVDQTVGISIFYRSINGSGIASTVPNFISLDKVRVAAEDGTPIETYGSHLKVIGGWRKEPITESPKVFHGQKLQFELDKPGVSRSSDYRKSSADWQTLLSVKRPGKLSLSFDVANLGNRESGESLVTGVAEIVVVASTPLDSEVQASSLKISEPVQLPVLEWKTLTPPGLFQVDEESSIGSTD